MILILLVLPEAATRKPTVSMPEAYKKISIRAEGSASRYKSRNIVFEFFARFF
jgi:hypothetical protein